MDRVTVHSGRPCSATDRFQHELRVGVHNRHVAVAKCTGTRQRENLRSAERHVHVEVVVVSGGTAAVRDGERTGVFACRGRQDA